MNNNYLIPANSKKSMLILGYFTTVDLILFGVGCVTTLTLLVVLNTNKLGTIILILLPALITGLLVMPVPNYHYVRTFIKIAWEFYTTRQKYIWKGWCFSDEEEASKE